MRDAEKASLLFMAEATTVFRTMFRAKRLALQYLQENHGSLSPLLVIADPLDRSHRLSPCAACNAPSQCLSMVLFFSSVDATTLSYGWKRLSRRPAGETGFPNAGDNSTLL